MIRESSKRGPSNPGLPRRRGHFLTPHNWFIPDGLKDWSEGTTFSNNSLCWFKVKVATAARNQQFPKHPWFTSNLVAPSTMNWGSDTNSEARFHVTHGILPFKDVEFGRNSGSSNNSPDCWHLLENIKEHVNFCILCFCDFHAKNDVLIYLKIIQIKSN